MTFSDFKALMESDRTVRRFRQDMRIDTATLEHLVDLTRYCASGRNAQPLRYRIVQTPEECAAVFPHLAWAGYYTDWDGPAEGERPAAYLVQCLDTDLGNNSLCDDGLHLQAITLGARTLGLGGCIIKAFNAQGVADALGIADRYAPRYVLALGAPAEDVCLVPMPADGDFKYFRRADGMHCVPKRSLNDLLI